MGTHAFSKVNVCKCCHACGAELGRAHIYDNPSMLQCYSMASLWQLVAHQCFSLLEKWCCMVLNPGVLTVLAALLATPRHLLDVDLLQNLALLSRKKGKQRPRRRASNLVGRLKQPVLTSAPGSPGQIIGDTSCPPPKLTNQRLPISVAVSFKEKSKHQLDCLRVRLTDLPPTILACDCETFYDFVHAFAFTTLGDGSRWVVDRRRARGQTASNCYLKWRRSEGHHLHQRMAFGAFRTNFLSSSCGKRQYRPPGHMVGLTFQCLHICRHKCMFIGFHRQPQELISPGDKRNRDAFKSTLRDPKHPDLQNGKGVVA